MDKATLKTLLQSFTFQYGEIKSGAGGAVPADALTFTFQYGEIKRRNVKRLKSTSVTFTFQYGEIKSFSGQPIELRSGVIYIPVWRD